MKIGKLVSMIGAFMMFAMFANTCVAECNCSETTLLNTQAKVHYCNYAPSTDWNGLVSGVVELPSGNNTLVWNNPQRFNIDLQASKVRIEFARDATYGQPSWFTFTLNPFAPPPCGTARIIGSSVTTNRVDAASYVISQSSFSSSANTVTIQFGNQGSTPFANWRRGDWIEAKLTFDCQSIPSTCCPPVNKQIVQGLFKHQGNAVNTYTMPLDMSTGATTSSFVNGLNAYLSYLSFVCPQTVKLKTEFFTGPVAAPTTMGGPAGPLVGIDLTVPKSSIITTTMTIPSLNAALTAMNNYPHVNGQYYRISVKITGLNAAGQTVNCGFNAQDCAIDDTFGFVFNTTSKVEAGFKPYTD